MKIEFLNNSLTEARVTRGALWWKRVAVLRQESFSLWKFLPSGDGATRYLSESLSMAAVTIKTKEKRERNWQPLRALPEAKAVRR